MVWGQTQPQKLIILVIRIENSSRFAYPHQPILKLLLLLRPLLAPVLSPPLPPPLPPPPASYPGGSGVPRG